MKNIVTVLGFLLFGQIAYASLPVDNQRERLAGHESCLQPDEKGRYLYAFYTSEQNVESGDISFILREELMPDQEFRARMQTLHNHEKYLQELEKLSQITAGQEFRLVSLLAAYKENEHQQCRHLIGRVEDLLNRSAVV